MFRPSGCFRIAPYFYSFVSLSHCDFILSLKGKQVHQSETTNKARDETTTDVKGDVNEELNWSFDISA